MRFRQCRKPFNGGSDFLSSLLNNFALTHPHTQAMTFTEIPKAIIPRDAAMDFQYGSGRLRGWGLARCSPMRRVVMARLSIALRTSPNAFSCTLRLSVGW